MWNWKKNWIVGVLGLWLVLLGLLGLPSSVQRILIIITGLIIAFISFKRGINEVVNEKIS
ncbi:MAG: hypothetical protein NTX55_02170 [Candidatus Parcubacteria bacterium]|nr:hypothetical protein [Candidatus Parcubacteria bacterium]